MKFAIYIPQWSWANWANNYIKSHLHLAYGKVAVKMGMLIKMDHIEFAEKRLYIFDGFDDYPIATLDAAKST